MPKLMNMISHLNVEHRFFPISLKVEENIFNLKNCEQTIYFSTGITPKPFGVEKGFKTSTSSISSFHRVKEVCPRIP